MRIRVFSEQDQDAVLALWRRCGLTVGWNDPAKDITRKLQVQPELFLVGLFDQVLVGSVMGGYDGHRGWLYYLAVDPDYRGRGWGRQLVSAVAARLEAIGCPKLNIMVRRSNEPVIDFYLKEGFLEDEVACFGRRLIDD
jgi:ribosomal protein S18 acetylase RimI-like enzyme